MKLLNISHSALLHSLITVALFNSNTSASTHYDTLRRAKRTKTFQVNNFFHVKSNVYFMYRQACHSFFPWPAHKERFTDIRTNSDPFPKYVAEKECLYSAARTENSNEMAVNIGIPMFTRANVLADRLTLNKEFRVAPLHVRFVEDEMTVRAFLSPTGIPFSFQSEFHNSFKALTTQQTLISWST